jgi:DNA-binding CsgD family transcriptional regulator
MPLRKGRETYGKKYEEAIAMHRQGRSPREISDTLGVSYSAAYHWVKGLRKPELGNVNEFIEYLRESGPAPVLEIEKKFPKHNELFLMANKRGLMVKRHVLKRKFAKYSVWYYLEGQETILEKRLEELFSKVRNARDKLRDALF